VSELLDTHEIGTDRERLDGRAKVTGAAVYAMEHPADDVAHVHIVQATIAKGRITALHTADAEVVPGVLAVLTHRNAPRLGSTDDAELAVLQGDEVAFRGQIVAAVIAESSEAARQAAGLVRVDYAVEDHDVELRADHPDLYAPEQVNAGHETDTSQGDVDALLASAPVVVDHTYVTPPEFNNPMEPHATTARWTDEGLHLFDSTQGVHSVRTTLAPVLGLEPEQIRVEAPYVGGGFGSKGLPHANVVLAAMAARTVKGRPVRLALTRQQMFSLAGHRTPTIQRVALAADTDGTLQAIVHEAVVHTSTVKEFAEQAAVPMRMLYASPSRRTSHRVAPLDVPVASWMRAPGECPGMFAPEVALDELAEALAMDPVELRVHNDTQVDPENDKPFSSRHLVECLHEGARRFGWQPGPPGTRRRREGRWSVGAGVASSVYPVLSQAGSTARIRTGASGRFSVQIGAVDIGTGAWTALAQIAADALGVPIECVDIEIGDTSLPKARVAGGSTGTGSWGSAIVAAARELRARYGHRPPLGVEVEGRSVDPDNDEFSTYGFGAMFAEARVDADTGEVRVPRMLGVFGVGRVVNPRTARSQLRGGMTMGLSMALHEHGVLDPRTGHVVNHDLAEYHIATNADVPAIEVHWLDERDEHVNPMGTKGIGEIGIVGSAAAIANATYDATGVRVRQLPITADGFVLADVG
jgi:xanthine dehydrogenase YagR molybdenum-binding subunit